MEKHHEQILKAAYENKLSELQAMNLLQDRGIISDLCVWIADIAKEDAELAIKFLNYYDHDTGQSISR